jgi:filamentous hemagglutinin family protein
MNKKCIREPIGRGVAPNYRLALLPAMLMAVVGTAWAVDGGVVAAGAGAIKTQGKTTTISQSSDKMIVNWKNFNIGKDQSVIVNQPGATSAVLNRVTTANPTQIDGTLKANGRVFVVNPAGVVFGKSAKVDVGSLVASTLDMHDQEFMDGGQPYGGNYRSLNLYPGQADGHVTNNGKLVAQGAVILVGPQVTNSGVIVAKDVTLGAANGAAMVMNDSSLRVVLGKQAQNALAANHGSITANGGDVLLSTSATGAVIGTVIQNTGRIEATSASAREGGTIRLSSMDGGKISVGGRVSADNRIEVSSEAQGGIITPAGTFLDPSVARARVYSAPSTHDVTVESGAKLASKGSVNISSYGGKVDMNGVINAGSDVNIDSTVMKYGDMGPETADGVITTNGRINAQTAQLMSNVININAPIKTVKNVYVESYSGDVNQRANVTSTNGSIYLLAGGNIKQADGVKTSAAHAVTLDTDSNYWSYRLRSNEIRAANIAAETINIRGGDIKLAGNLNADNDISVKSKTYSPSCPSGMSCIAVLTGGHLAQAGNVISRDGNVTLDASSSISRQSKSRTSAGKVVTLDSFAVDTGKIDAGKQINVNAYIARLGGKLTAPEITLPDNTENVKGNVRILPESASL